MPIKKEKTSINVKAEEQPTRRTKLSEIFLAANNVIEKYRLQIFWISLYCMITIGIFLERFFCKFVLLIRKQPIWKLNNSVLLYFFILSHLFPLPCGAGSTVPREGFDSSVIMPFSWCVVTVTLSI